MAGSSYIGQAARQRHADYVQTLTDRNSSDRQHDVVRPADHQLGHLPQRVHTTPAGSSASTATTGRYFADDVPNDLGGTEVTPCAGVAPLRHSSRLNPAPASWVAEPEHLEVIGFTSPRLTAARRSGRKLVVARPSRIWVVAAWTPSGRGCR